MLSVLNGLIRPATQFLNLHKEVIKTAGGGFATACGLVAVADIMSGGLTDSTSIRGDEPSWMRTALKVARASAELSLLFYALSSRPALFLACHTLGYIFSEAQLLRLFGANTTFALNPWHPRHVLSVVAFLLSLPNLLLNICQAGSWIYHKACGTLPISEDNTSPTVIYSGRSVNLVVSDHPLADGALKLVPKINASYAPLDDAEALEISQAVARILEKKGINDYLMFRQESPNTLASWEIVPYPNQGWAVWQQLKVFARIAFGSSYLPEAAREAVVQEYNINDVDILSALPQPAPKSRALQHSINEEDLLASGKLEDKPLEVNFNETPRPDSDTYLIPVPLTTRPVGADAFCNPDTISRQLVEGGEHINLLQDYRPVAPDHLLAVPKQHCPRFTDLTREEIQEVATLWGKVSQGYRNSWIPSPELAGQAIFFYHKTGSRAGQTVDHWHGHMISVDSVAQSIFGKLRVLKNILFGSLPIVGASPLPPDALAAKVAAVKQRMAHSDYSRASLQIPSIPPRALPARICRLSDRALSGLLLITTVFGRVTTHLVNAFVRARGWI